MTKLLREINLDLTIAAEEIGLDLTTDPREISLCLTIAAEETARDLTAATTEVATAEADTVLIAITEVLTIEGKYLPRQENPAIFQREAMVDLLT